MTNKNNKKKKRRKKETEKETWDNRVNFLVLFFSPVDIIELFNHQTRFHRYFWNTRQYGASICKLHVSQIRDLIKGAPYIEASLQTRDVHSVLSVSCTLRLRFTKGNEDGLLIDRSNAGNGSAFHTLWLAGTREYLPLNLPFFPYFSSDPRSTSFLYLTFFLFFSFFFYFSFIFHTHSHFFSITRSISLSVSLSFFYFFFFFAIIVIVIVLRIIAQSIALFLVDHLAVPSFQIHRQNYVCVIM